VQIYDVAIVGAGPAGSAAAIRLARAGASVLLLDKARFPRDKPCGGGLTTRALAEIPVDPEPVVEARVDTLDFGFRYTRRFSRRTAAPLVLMTQRRRLDAFLLDQARLAGADAREEENVREPERLLEQADVLVGADGANGSTRKLLETDYAYGVAYEGNIGGEHDFGSRALLDLCTVPGGYSWLFPKGDHVNIGVGGWESEGPRMREKLAEATRAYGLDPARLTNVRGHRLPLRRTSDIPAKGNVVLIGDAAGLVDPLSGDGMYEAFFSARLAAEAILAGEPEAYGARVAAALHRQQQAAWAIKRALDRTPRLAYAIVRTRLAWRLAETVLMGGSDAIETAAASVRAPLRALETLGR
jgi:geranylgeranyl reductase family protein